MKRLFLAFLGALRAFAVKGSAFAIEDN